MELVKTTLLSDKTSYLQLFGHTDTIFYNRDFEKNILTSTWNDFPTKQNPNARYKYLSIYI